MSPMLLRIVAGNALMVVACLVAFTAGGKPERRTALLVAVCAALIAVGEAATGHRAEPVIAGDFVFGFGLLVLVWKYGVVWLWILFTLVAMLFFMHAFLYQGGRPPSGAYVLMNDLIVTTAMAILLFASLRRWRACSGMDRRFASVD